MNAMIVENIVNWFLFALVTTCTLSFASTVYDHFIGSKRRDHDSKTTTRLVSSTRASPLAAEPTTIRGYDTPELFREDLWIRRIEHSRKAHATLLASIPQVKASWVTSKDTPRRLCEMLAQHAQPGRDN
jgi:hypothetical protein